MNDYRNGKVNALAGEQEAGRDFEIYAVKLRNIKPTRKNREGQIHSRLILQFTETDQASYSALEHTTDLKRAHQY